MTPLEFVERYYLHDSNIERVDFDADKKVLTLIIEFCFWWQPWHKKDEPKNGLICVTFKDVSSFEYDAESFADELNREISGADFDEDGVLIIYLYTTSCSITEFKIKAAGVEVEELARYTL